ncbi:DUF1045 domain-containing protein [Paracoccus sp. S-4012]|uniref:DUF1045 domain-containing protein n=1 Tax=Paracoccus sp. S-4012 TaxID=2665648 RepID=UPI0012B02767|nr:DUF1045 domain-containing protein [Paracoccus sp. S-4012]MRX49315.1 DUF1045 domain-containing protein [Paracoccus sp. S-4012]
MTFRRFAVYHMAEGDLGRFGAEWLGWDAAEGRGVEQPRVEGVDIEAVTRTPRRYGFHATMAAPFRPAVGIGADELRATLAAFCRGEAPAALTGGLHLARLHGFLALIPAGSSDALSALESRLVEAMDRFRAPLTRDEIASRRPDRLTERQRENLRRWGYPYVKDEFRFHMTLSGDLDAATLDRLEAALRDRLPPIPNPYPLTTLSLMGEDEDGCFHRLAHLPLGGG